MGARLRGMARTAGEWGSVKSHPAGHRPLLLPAPYEPSGELALRVHSRIACPVAHLRALRFYSWTPAEPRCEAEPSPAAERGQPSPARRRLVLATAGCPRRFSATAPEPHSSPFRHKLNR